MKNKDFLSFLLHEEKAPSFLKENTRKEILLTFKKKAIISRFISLQLLGILISLAFCPQFGLGFVGGHGISHFFRLIGDWACAAFCGSLFLSAGMMMAFIGMKGEELWWIWKRYKITLVFLPVIFWSLLMLTNFRLDLPTETMMYHFVWIATAVTVQTLWFSLRSYLHVNEGSSH